MTTLFDIVFAMAKYSQPMQAGAATAGSTTSLTDTSHPSLAGYFDGGTIFFITGQYAGQWAKISAYDGTGFTFSALGVQPVHVGELYAAVPKNIPVEDYIIGVNDALFYMGKTLAEDTSLITVANQEDYTLPTAPNAVFDLRKVEIATSLTAPYNYKVHYHWDEIGGTLRFRTRWLPSTSGYIIRLTYRGAHPALMYSYDTISNYVSPQWLIWTALANVIRAYGLRGHYADPAIKIGLEEAQARAQAERRPSSDIVIVKLAG